jgi:hypothetical protein
MPKYYTLVGYQSRGVSWAPRVPPVPEEPPRPVEEPEADHLGDVEEVVMVERPERADTEHLHERPARPATNRRFVRPRAR